MVDYFWRCFEVVVEDEWVNEWMDTDFMCFV